MLVATGKEFLEDAKGDFSSAFDLIGDDTEKNRRALRLLIEGLEKSIKALWLGAYDDIIAPFLDFMENKRGCRKQTVHEIRMLKDPKHLGHAASLKVLKALVDMTYLVACLDTCKLQPKELVMYMYNEIEKFIEIYSEKIVEDNEFVNEAKRDHEKIRDVDINTFIQRLFNEFEDKAYKQMEKLKNNINLLIEKIDCEEVKGIKKKIDDYIKKDKPDKKGRRAIAEDCMKISTQHINDEVDNTKKLLNIIGTENNKLVSDIKKSIYTVIDEFKEEPVIRDILELPRIRNMVDNITGELVALVMKKLGYLYGTLALARLHLIIYPCYWPSRYKHEGQISSEILDKEVLRELYDIVYKLVNYIERQLFKNNNIKFIA